MTLVIILGLLLVLLLTGAPIFAALGLASLIITLLTEGHVHSIADTVFAKLNNNLLTAIPMFAFMAFIMIRSKVVDHLYEAANAMVRLEPISTAVLMAPSCTSSVRLPRAKAKGWAVR